GRDDRHERSVSAIPESLAGSPRRSERSLSAVAAAVFVAFCKGRLRDAHDDELLLDTSLGRRRTDAVVSSAIAVLEHDGAPLRNAVTCGCETASLTGQSSAQRAIMATDAIIVTSGSAPRGGARL